MNIGNLRLSVLAIVADPGAREIFSKVVQEDPLDITEDLSQGLTLAGARPPDVAFVEVGMGRGAGLALVHHIKAVVPNVTVYALASREALEIAANAVALGGAGVLTMPVDGDDLLSALAAVRAKLLDRLMRAELERAALTYARAAGWMTRVAELADLASRTLAAERLIAVLLEATEVAGAAVYLSTGEQANDLARVAVSAALDRAPQLATEHSILELARREHLLVVPLAVRSIKAGHVLLLPAGPSSHAPSPAEHPRLDGLVKLLATQAATVFALLGERERGACASIKDPASSAYSFAYYVDVAGREIDKARRYNRRFAIATVAFEPADEGTVSHAEMADQLLKAARDTDILAHVDEHEFHLLMPETDGLVAHAGRRRILSRLAERGAVPRGLLVGVSTFPHDGPNLSQLLRVARRRAEATRHSVVHSLSPDRTSLLDLLDLDPRKVDPPLENAVTMARRFDLPLAAVVALAGTVVADALRGGSALVVVAHHECLRVGAAVRAALGLPRENVTFYAVDVRSATPGSTVEILAVIAEHGAYGLIGRSEGGMVRGIHAADPLFADVLAERMGRAAGLRLFS